MSSALPHSVEKIMRHTMAISLWDRAAAAGLPATYEIEFRDTGEGMRILVRPVDPDGRKKCFSCVAGPSLVKDMAKFFYAVAKNGGA